MTNVPEYIDKRIEEVRDQGLKELDLSYGPKEKGNKLINIPASVFELKNLERLILSGQRLSRIPTSISRLANLTALVLDRNNFQTIPKSLTRLRKLRSLDLSGNKLIRVPTWIPQLSTLTELGLRDTELNEVPQEISQLNKLTKLDLGHNKLGTFPEGIRGLTSLRELKLPANALADLPKWLPELRNLTYLDLGYNKLSTLPPWFSQMQALTVLWLPDNSIRTVPKVIRELKSLEELGLSSNQIANLPNWISELEQLRSLNLFNNRMKEVPASISSLKNLSWIRLKNNKFETVPDAIYQSRSLTHIDLGNLEHIKNKNRIKTISPRILEMENLIGLELENCHVETPPAEVVAKGIQAVRHYFRQLQTEGKDFLYEAKLLVIGEGGAGKTSLIKKIADENYELHEEDSTKGVEVTRWTFLMENGEPFRVNIWDFGGQEIYHSTHQFFLTKRSLYVLVADTRKEDTDFYYWLNVVELLSDNSPLLIIKNEKQDRSREISERQLRGQFSNVKETLATNLATNRGLDRVVEEIKHSIVHLPQIGAPLPKTWVKVREALEKDPRNYISLGEYLDICELNGFNSSKDKLQLSGYLHDLGVCLHFQDDPLLKKTIILKPKWGTDAAYKVLDNKTVIDNLGKFSRADLTAIWHESAYENMQDELLRLMSNFELCCQIPNSEMYIAPQLLTENQPPYNWDDNSLILRYTYESFMPKGIVTQFIVAMHKLIWEQRYVWRSGVILERDRTKAEVIEYYSKRELRIRIAGKNKKDLMTVVTYELDKIHASYNRLRYSTLIPCNCSKCTASKEPHFYPLEVLQQFVDDNQELIQCQRSYQMIAVQSLIDEVIDRGRVATMDRPRSQPRRDQVFISYSHLDKEWLTKLQTMLRPLARNNQITVWADTDIAAGSKWRQEIADAIASAKVAVLLVSPNFLASDFIAEHELPPLLNPDGQKGPSILWVAVSDSLYEETEIGSYQAANDPGKPLDSLSVAEVNRTLANVAKKIKLAVNG